MIRTFGDRETKAVFGREPVKKFASIQRAAQRRLDHIQAATSLRDVVAIPGNRLEALKGDLKGFHSIRINDQWRIILRWVEQAAEDVAIRDYH